MNEKEMLDTITELSHFFGTEKYVRAGGGNTSCKTDEILWVKPSGTTLACLQPDKFVKMDRSKIKLLYSAETPKEANAREELVKNMMMDALLPESRGRRASVEAALHDSLSARFVVHTHPAWVNGLTCSVCGELISKKLFPDALWVPYVDPGYTLAMAVRKAVKDYQSKHDGKDPGIIFLGNHGVFVSADTADGIHALYDEIETKLFEVYEQAKIDPKYLEFGELKATPKMIEDWKTILKEALGEDGAEIAICAPLDVPDGPLTPDHIVYAKSFFYFGTMTVDNLRSAKEARGYAPRLISLPEALIGVGKAEKAAKLALELGQDAALVKQTARAFGGVQYMSDRSRQFIETWEVESYRAKQQA